MKFTVDWFSANIPTFEKIKSFTPIKKVLEIGVHEGMSTCWMLDKLLPENGSILCIDPLPQERYQLFCENVEEVKRANQTVTFYQETSRDSLPHLLMFDAQYDFIYIDGSHEAPDVLFDTVNCWQLLRKGGVMLLDDYGGGAGVQKGAAGFLDAFSGQYEFLEKGYQLGLVKL